MQVHEMTEHHLRNAIKYWNRLLAQKPATQVYMGISDCGEDWVEGENKHNEHLAQCMRDRIAQLEQELSTRITLQK